MAFHVTQCPGCDSTFNASARLLESAHGRVRCGACLTVFDAVEYFIDQAQSRDDQTSEESVFVGNNPLDYFNPSVFLTRAALTEDEDIGIEEQTSDSIESAIETPAQVQFDQDFFAAVAAELQPPSEPTEPTALDATQPILAAAVTPVPASEPEEFSEFDPHPAPEPEPEPEQTIQPRTSRLEDIKLAVSFLLPPAPQIKAEQQTITEQPVAALDEVTSQAGEQSEQVQLEHAFLDAVADGAEHAEVKAEAEGNELEQDSTAAIRARALQTELEDEDALEPIPEENLASLGRVAPPLELTTKRESRWLRSLVLSLVTLLLLGTLIAQFLWQRTSLYSQVAQVRPLYEWACQWVACALPEYSDIDAIRSDNLVVRSHPEIANALMINIVFRNTADFPQAFPILILSFNTVTNNIVALREFAPSEYLNSGLQNLSLMPVMSPVQVNLELIDPGPDAVNYTLAFRRP